MTVTNPSSRGGLDPVDCKSSDFFYFQCLPNEKEEIEREHNLSRQGSLMKVPRDFTDSKHLIDNEYKDSEYKDATVEYQDSNDYRDNNHYQGGAERTPPPTETDF